MSERKWTKGPWEVVEHSWSDTSVVGPDGTICTIRIYDEATEDNQSELEQRSASRAHLIAAAPKMLEALLRISSGNEINACLMQDIARAALSAAEGGV